MATLRFAADIMLGRLATWLRLLGHDTTYGTHLFGKALLRHARLEGRTILTRDRHLQPALSWPALLFIDSDHFREQLRQVVSAFDLDPFVRIFTRCVRCNEPVEVVSPAEVRDRVPPYVFATQERFVRCPRCHRIYWPATHAQRVRNELRAMRLGCTTVGGA